MSEQNNNENKKPERKLKELIPIDFTRFATSTSQTAEESRLEEESKKLDGKQDGNSAGNNNGNEQGNKTSNTDGNTDGKIDGNNTSNEEGKTQGNMGGNETSNSTGNDTRNEASNSTGNKKVGLPPKEPRKYKKKSSLLDEIRSEKKTRNKITIYLDRDIDDALKQIAGITRNGMKSEYINRILRDQMIKDGLLDGE